MKLSEGSPGPVLARSILVGARPKFGSEMVHPDNRLHWNKNRSYGHAKFFFGLFQIRNLDPKKVDPDDRLHWNKNIS